MYFKASTISHVFICVYVCFPFLFVVCIVYFMKFCKILLCVGAANTMILSLIQSFCQDRGFANSFYCKMLLHH